MIAHQTWFVLATAWLSGLPHPFALCSRNRKRGHMSKHKFTAAISTARMPKRLRNDASRQRIIDAYRRDKLLLCDVCGYQTRHCWDVGASLFTCSCGTSRKDEK
jgi:hypothetical protein